MAKLAIVAALLVAFLALGEATTAFTTTTTAEEDQENPWEMCRRQVMGRRFRYCQRFLKQAGKTVPYEVEEYSSSELDDSSNNNLISMVTADTEKMPYLMECCQQLRGIDAKCRCDAIRHMMKMGAGHEQMAPEMMIKAKYLPHMCKMGPQCQMKAVLI